MTNTTSSGETNQISDQIALMNIHRRRLAHLLRQQAIFGLFTPSYIAHDIADARAEIARLKTDIRSAGNTAQDALGDTPGSSWVERRSWLIRIAQFVVFTLVLALIIIPLNGGIPAIERQLDEYGIRPMIQPEQPGEVLLLIIPFRYTEGNRNTDAHNEIRRAIETQRQQLGLSNLRIAMASTPLAADDRTSAERLGSRYNASLLIWGEDTGARVSVSFLNRRDHSELIDASDVDIEETARTQIANPPAYSTFIVDEIPRQMSFLALYAIGQSYVVAEDNEQALRIIKQAVDIVPPDAQFEGLANAYFRLGWLQQFLKKDSAQIIAIYTKAIALEPYAVIYDNRGVAYADQGEVDKAIADYTQAIRLDPYYVSAYYNRAISYAEQGQFEKAIADYNQVLTLDPKDTAAYNNRGSIYFKQDKVNEAIADYSKAIELKPQYAHAYNNRGYAYSTQGKQDQAISDLSKAIAFKPNYMTAYFNRGNVYRAEGKLDEAISDYTQAITIDPQEASAYNYRGDVYKTKGKLDEAISDYTQAITIDPQDARAYVARGGIYIIQGDLEKAIIDIEHAHDLNKNVELEKLIQVILNELHALEKNKQLAPK